MVNDLNTDTINHQNFEAPTLFEQNHFDKYPNLLKPQLPDDPHQSVNLPASIQSSSSSPNTIRNRTIRSVSNLSWNFFEQISILDYQLRDEDCEIIIMSSSGSPTSTGTVPVNINYNPKSIAIPPIPTNINNNNNSNNNNNNNHHQLQQHHHHQKNTSVIIPPTPPFQINNLSNSSGGKIQNETMINASTIGCTAADQRAGNRQGITNYPSTNSTSPGTLPAPATATATATAAMATGSGNSTRIHQRNRCSDSPSGDCPTHQYGIGFHLGLCGWRKKCLYTLILVLMLLIIVNLVLTLWILKVMEFSSEGMGQLKIVPGGIQLSGQALIMDLLRASTIRSKHGQPIILESSRNFSINTRDSEGILENHLFLGHDKLECLATGFRINDTSGRNLFSVNRDEVTIGAHSLRIDGEGGAIFRESIQTPHVRAEAGRELRLESPTRQLEMTAAKDITIQSRAGGLEMTALDDIKLSAIDGSIRLESSKIFLPNLKAAQLLSSGTVQNSRGDHSHRVYQLCACSNGKLFLAAPHSICAGDDSSVCR